jgi:fermentation-respiration switch protein FrsA (DUF1100 family)
LTQPEALPGFEAICGNRSLWRNEFFPSLLKRPYRPVRASYRVRCPLLVCLGERDHMAPRRAAELTVKRAPHGELRAYPIDHFGGFLDGGFEDVVADQTEFLSRHLLAARAPSSAGLRFSGP